MAVTVGGSVEATDFTGAKDRVLAVLGNGSGQSGYGQIVASAENYAISANDELISRNEWNTLIDDVNKCYQHQAGASGLNISFSTGDIVGANASGTDVRTYFSVDSIDILYAGEGIASLNLTVSAPEEAGGTTATLSTTIDAGGQLTQVNVTNAGSGYLTTPTITITGTFTQEPVLRVNLVFDETVLEGRNNFKGILDVLSSISEIEADANVIAAGQFALTDTRAFTSSTRFSPWGGDGDPDDNIFCELDVRFKGQYDTTNSAGTRVTASESDHRRHFFNAGGEIHISFDGTDNTDKDANWQSMFNTIGIVKFRKNDTTVTGTGLARDGSTDVNGGGIDSAVGNFQLSTAYTLIFRKTGSGVYSANYLDIEAKRVNGFDGAGDPYEAVRFRITFFDNAEGNPNFDERVLISGGTQVAGIDLKRPNDASAVLIPVPDDFVETEFQST